MSEKTLQKSTVRRKDSGPRPRYVLLWENIQLLQQKLLDQESTNKSILRQFSNKIRPLEESVIQELIGLTNSLIERFHNEESDASRSLIGFWIIENFTVLAAHPFANSTEVESLYDDWRLPIQRTDDMVEASLSQLMAGRSDLPGQSNKRSNYPDADMFAANRVKSTTHGSQKSQDTEKMSSAGASQRSNSINEEIFHQHSSKNRPKNTPRKEAAPSVGKKRSSSNSFEELFNIDNLFRRIARAVHPDREQDETKKAEKHAIMSECLQAREEENIAKLLTLYANHVGALPDTWSNESTGTLVNALEEQLRELETKIAAIQVQDPLLQMILDRYLGYDTNDVDRRIQTHQDSLTVEINRLQSQRDSLKTDQGWAVALKERRDIELDKLVVAELTQ